jgi:hypothetical protein
MHRHRGFSRAAGSSNALPQHRRFAVTDDIPLSPYVYEGLDPAAECRPTRSALSEALKDTIGLVSYTIEAARRPGMPLGILSSITREAPLGSLTVAFLLGAAFARRRMR